MLAASKVDSQALSDQCGAGQSSTAGSSTSARAERRRPSVHDIQGIAVEIAGDVAPELVGEGLRGASARPMNGSRYTLGPVLINDDQLMAVFGAHPDIAESAAMSETCQKRPCASCGETREQLKSYWYSRVNGQCANP